MNLKSNAFAFFVGHLCFSITRILYTFPLMLNVFVMLCFVMYMHVVYPYLYIMPLGCSITICTATNIIIFMN